MSKQLSDIGLIGLGTMGRSLVLNMADHGFAVGVFNRTASVTEEFAAGLEPGQDVAPRYTLDDLLASLETPRRIMLMVDAGKAVDAVLAGLDPLLQAGDIVIDGGNSYFKDTERRAGALGGRGIRYLGVGISGGESGARHGPSMMPGGPREAYEAVRPIFEAIAAQADGARCVAYLGAGACGHYVKMVHNGIEYGLMQLISEAYALLRLGLGLDNIGIAATFAEWQAGELESYLVEITAMIFRRADEQTGAALIDLILGEAAQKGTGMWTSQHAMDLHVPVPNIDVAVSMRNLSGLLEQRTAARETAARETAAASGAAAQSAGAGKPSGITPAAGTPAAGALARGFTIQVVREALYAATILTYIQGFAQLQQASTTQSYDLALRDVASIWRGGCIIRSALLRQIKAGFERQPYLPNLLIDPELSRLVTDRRPALVAAVEAGIAAGIPVPGLLTALSYLDAYLADWLPTNLIQAQRDYFGAHTYRRIDKEGIFHTDWAEDR
jgi:6-phosphogluconate dehydrogenase